ncbi:MAG: site-specific DNA-methyltransferase, partial [Fimbriimonadaceae bacterium]|nr:site-specific DNA-methyltransferase [Fimbriimonadaceae bacterium]
REPEMVKAYRDTWTLGVHSYLSYLRDRLLLCKELLADSGSIFVQISDENLHRVRSLLDEVFGAENTISVISFTTTGGFATKFLSRAGDYLLWYAKDKEKARYYQLYRLKADGGLQGDDYRYHQTPEGELKTATEEEHAVVDLMRLDNTVSQGAASGPQPIEISGRIYSPNERTHWKAQYPTGMTRLTQAGRLFARSDSLAYKRFVSDYPAFEQTSLWGDTSIAGTAAGKAYIVSTNPKVIERCILMTTSPGDLVLDPTCGGGTTALEAEDLGRRWITADTSRVALSIARQRLMTARFDSYKMRALDGKDVGQNPSGTWLTDPSGELSGPVTFDCKTVPHITLKSIAQNQALDPVFDRWDPQLREACERANDALRACPADLRVKLLTKAKDSLGEKKANSVGNDLAKLKKALSDADWRRWVLPPDLKPTRNYTTVANDFDGWYEWEMPFDADPDWPQPLQDAVRRYRELWKAKMKEVNDTIAARAEQEELVDQPIKVPGVLRVSGPFTVEGVIPVEENIDVDEESPIEPYDEELDTFEPGANGSTSIDVADVSNADSYLDQMTGLLRKDGVRFLNNKVQEFARLDRVMGATHHAEGEWENGPDGNAAKSVYVVFGPQYGALTRGVVDDVLARSRKADVVLFVGFSFDAEASGELGYRKELFEAEQKRDPGSTNVQQVEMVQIRPDANPAMGDLLKTTVHQQLFTVSGTPRTRLGKSPTGELQVLMEGVDIYDPIENVVRSSGADKVAAWFVDGDYDGRTFCVTQAFFPDKSAWEKIAKHLDKSGAVDMERFEAFSGTTSLPFPPGKHKRVAVKVIDPRGNEVMKVHRLEGFGS